MTTILALYFLSQIPLPTEPLPTREECLACQRLCHGYKKVLECQMVYELRPGEQADMLLAVRWCERLSDFWLSVGYFIELRASRATENRKDSWVHWVTAWRWYWPHEVWPPPCPLWRFRGG